LAEKLDWQGSHIFLLSFLIAYATAGRFLIVHDQNPLLFALEKCQMGQEYPLVDDHV